MKLSSCSASPTHSEREVCTATIQNHWSGVTSSDTPDEPDQPNPDDGIKVSYYHLQLLAN